jgi:hypothetical protein
MGGMFDRGLKLRREVLGAEYVDNSLKSANCSPMAGRSFTVTRLIVYTAQQLSQPFSIVSR